MSEALGTIEEQAGQWCFNLGINIGVAPPGGSNQDDFPRIRTTLQPSSTACS